MERPDAVYEFSLRPWNSSQVRSVLPWPLRLRCVAFYDMLHQKELALWVERMSGLNSTPTISHHDLFFTLSFLLLLSDLRGPDGHLYSG